MIGVERVSGNQFFEVQEIIHVLSLQALAGVELPEEHSDLKEIVWNTLKDYKGNNTESLK